MANLEGANGSTDNIMNEVLSLLGDDTPTAGDTPSEKEQEPIEETAAPEPEEQTEEVAETKAESEEDEELFDFESHRNLKVKLKDGRVVNLADLETSNMAEADYRNKTMQLADERRGIEAEKQKYIDGLTKVIELAQVTDPVLREGVKADWKKLSEEDPAGTQTKWFEFQNRVGNLNRLIQEKDRLVAHQYETFKEEQAKILLEKKPELADEAKRTQFGKAMYSYLTERGFSPQETAEVIDHRYFDVFDDSIKWREHIANQESLKSKKVVKSPTKVISTSKSPSSGKSESADRLYASAKKTGSTKDLVSAILADI